MKAAFISDVHVGPTSYFKGVRRKLTEHAEKYIEQFVWNVIQSSNYTFAIQLGDLIQHADKQTDIENFQKAINLFSNCPCPVYHLVGNHDTIYLTSDDVRNILGYERLFFSFDAFDIHVVILHSYVPVPRKAEIVLPVRQLEWLRSDLAETDKPTIVFVHHSLADQDLTGNVWFEGRLDKCLVRNRKEVREIFANSGQVIAVINGHLHWNRVDIHDGIPYITVQSAVEDITEHGIPANSWGEVEVKNNTFCIRVFGNDTFEYNYEFSPQNLWQES